MGVYKDLVYSRRSSSSGKEREKLVIPLSALARTLSHPSHPPVAEDTNPTKNTIEG